MTSVDTAVAAIVEKVCDRVEMLVGLGDTELHHEVLCVGHDVWEVWGELGSVYDMRLCKAQQRFDALVAKCEAAREQG